MGRKSKLKKNRNKQKSEEFSKDVASDQTKPVDLDSQDRVDDSPKWEGDTMILLFYVFEELKKIKSDIGNDPEIVTLCFPDTGILKIFDTVFNYLHLKYKCKEFYPTFRDVSDILDDVYMIPSIPILTHVMPLTKAASDMDPDIINDSEGKRLSEENTKSTSMTSVTEKDSSNTEKCPTLKYVEQRMSVNSQIDSEIDSCDEKCLALQMQAMSITSSPDSVRKNKSREECSVVHRDIVERPLITCQQDITVNNKDKLRISIEEKNVQTEEQVRKNTKSTSITSLTEKHTSNTEKYPTSKYGEQRISVNSQIGSEIDSCNEECPALQMQAMSIISSPDSVRKNKSKEEYSAVHRDIVEKPLITCQQDTTVNNEDKERISIEEKNVQTEDQVRCTPNIGVNSDMFSIPDHRNALGSLGQLNSTECYEYLNKSIRLEEYFEMYSTEQHKISGNAFEVIPLSSEKTHHILHYEYRQTKIFFNVEIRIPNIERHPGDSIELRLTETSLGFYVDNLNGKDYVFFVQNLHGKVVPGECYYTILSADFVVLSIKKKKLFMWKSLFSVSTVTKTKWMTLMTNILDKSGCEDLTQKYVLECTWKKSLVIEQSCVDFLNPAEPLSYFNRNLSSLDQLISYALETLKRYLFLRNENMYMIGAATLRKIKSSAGKSLPKLNRIKMSREANEPPKTPPKAVDNSRMVASGEERKLHPNVEEAMKIVLEGEIKICEGIQLLEKGLYHESVVRYSEAILMTADPFFLRNRATSLFELKCYRDASNDARRALYSIGGVNGTDCVSILINAQIRIGNTVEALCIIKIYQDSPVGKDKRDILEQTKSTAVSNLQNVTLGANAFLKGDFRIALEHFEAVRLLCCGSRNLTMIVILLALVSENYEKAASSAEYILPVKMALPLTHYIIGKSYYHLGRLEEAASHFEKSVNIRPTNIAAQMLMKVNRLSC